MFAVRDMRTGKFLRNFSESYNRFEDHTGYKLFDTFDLTPEQAKAIHKNMWSLDTPDGAKLYKTIGGVKNSIGHHDWLQIVEVKVSLRCV